jgi:hypothetical protein
MNVTFSRLGADAVAFAFKADGQDAAPPLERLRVEATDVGRLREPRAALLAYLLVRDLIGNRLALRGLRMPAFLAAAILNQRAHPELHFEPVTNANAALALRTEPVRMLWGAPSAGRAGDLLAEAHDLGYRLRRLDAPALPGPVVGEIRADLRPFLALAARRPRAVERAALALLLCDTLGASVLRVAERDPATAALAGLLGHVGFRLDAAEAA